MMGRFMIFLAVSSAVLIVVNIYLSKRYARLLRDHSSLIPESAAAYVLFSGLAVFLSSLFFQNRIYQHRALTLPVRYISAFTSVWSYIHSFFSSGDTLTFLGSILSALESLIHFFQSICQRTVRSRSGFNHNSLRLLQRRGFQGHGI